MDTWLRDHLIASGHLTETGVTRRARLRRCGQWHLMSTADPSPVEAFAMRATKRDRVRRRCQQLVLIGLDSDACALEVTCDPTPLSPLGEAMALLEHRRTLTLRKAGAGWVLDWRDAHEITGSPAHTEPRRDVVATHVCGHPIPPGWAAPSTFPEVTPPPPSTARPPF